MHLVESFLPLFLYQLRLLERIARDQPPYPEVRAEVEELIRLSDGHPARTVVSQKEYAEARFAVCAWIDEGILNSGWQHKEPWLAAQLQRVYYGTSDAGELFFSRLKELEKVQQEVREVFYLCLALGFSGRFCQEEDAWQLEQVQASTLKLLRNGHLAPIDPEVPGLFSAPRPASGASPAPRRPLAALFSLGPICIAASLVLFAVLYLIYFLTLSGIGKNFLKTTGT
ncbi:type VI secretion system protein ImpK [Geomonas silvestris]|uniref:Type VI secretion system protein ImpK n=1 Tax=Geomonas silvestris TaxID=2740184 RepID=A0A6V8MDN4_9BACT|nr:DotU family type IV/VI secretion system protein [Geomonas silvestris]GFO58120.1 type VI secretion system protein ImpK [Geomonas silvestris]